LDMGRVRVAASSKAVPQLLSVPELAKLLQVPVATIYRWRHRGEGPEPIRVGRHLRFDPADVAVWLETRKAASAGRYRRGA
jgi:excisionase family DNA binding protein